MISEVRAMTAVGVTPLTAVTAAALAAPYGGWEVCWLYCRELN
jgi:hypothetical protein